MQRTERLFALTEYLRGRRTGVTAEALAERFGVTLRTIYRDLDTLRMAALPLRIPLPSSTDSGSIYVRQQDLGVRYFADAGKAAQTEPAE